MACQLNKAIKVLLEKPGTRRLINDIINNEKLATTAFGKIVQTHFNKNLSDISLKEFGKGFGRLIRDVTGVTVIKDKNFILNQISRYINEPAIAQFNPFTNKVVIASYTSKDEMVNTLNTEFYNELVSQGDKEVADELIRNDSISGVMEPKAEELFKTIQYAKGKNFLLHELVHAGTLEYIANNPNTRETNRITTIFNYLYKNHETLGIKETYWKTSVDEFIAEALTNTNFIQELLSIVPEKPVSRLTSMYDVLLSTFLRILGVQGKQLDNLFDILLDSTLKILEEKKVLSEQQKGTKKPSKESEGKSTGSDNKSSSEQSIRDLRDSEYERLADENASKQPAIIPDKNEDFTSTSKVKKPKKTSKISPNSNSVEALMQAAIDATDQVGIKNSISKVQTILTEGCKI